MKKSTWTPEKDLFGLYLANQGVKKMINESGNVLLVAWNFVSGEKIAQIEFESAMDYSEWMDAVVSDYDAEYNPARALLCVLGAMGV